MSPFQKSRIDHISSPLIGNGFEFDMLRDDLIHPIVSGNKWRKLKYIIEHIKNGEYKRLVTFGGAYSNHLVATAFAGKYFGIETHAFVRGDEVRPSNHYENICIENDMKLHHVSRSEYRYKENLFNDMFGNSKDTLFIDEGGDHPDALIGCAEILDELEKTYDIIILSLGTGTTAEGLVKEINNRNLPTRLFGISSLKNNFELDRKLSKYNSSSYKIFHDFHRGKYAKSDSELIDFIQTFHKETGIKTDTVYTGKMLMALNELQISGIIDNSSKVLAIHTGGLLAYPEDIKDQ